MAGLYHLAFDIALQNSHIEELYIRNTGIIDALSLLQSLPKLELLRIHIATLVIKRPTAVLTVKSIKHLDLMLTPRESWMAHLKFPNLQKLTYNDTHLTAFATFVSAHNSLAEIRTTLTWPEWE